MERNTAPVTEKIEHHLIHSAWIRRPLKVLLGVLIFILFIPVLIYLPPVQDALKDVACDYVRKSTGMNIGIEKFRLRFPLDISLQGVHVIEKSGDTMALAREALVDVKLRPLLNLNLDINKLQLRDGYYRMLSEDSSMTMKVRAGNLTVDGGSRVEIARSKILLNKVSLKDGDLNLYMNVWKQKSTPEDTTAKSTPFLILANDIALDNFRFGMSMLPTIDTLQLQANSIHLKGGVINLRENTITARRLAVSDGDFEYLTPTAEWVKAHPAPPPQPSSGPPMVIQGAEVSLDNFNVLYGVKGAKPQPGFDANYISMSGVSIGLKDFYNEQSSVRLPITRLTGRERCGLEITEGGGTVDIDSLGISLNKLNIRTLYSQINADAYLSFGMMAMQPNAPLRADLSGKIGIPDVTAFMPALKTYTNLLPTRNPITIDLAASGSLSSLNIPKLLVNVPSCVSLTASGQVDNPMEPDKLRGRLKFDGNLLNPAIIDKIAGPTGVNIPPLKLTGEANIAPDDYSADFRLTSQAGNVAARGHVALGREQYQADVTISNLNVMRFMPTLGLGEVSADIKAKGTGFNPTTGKAHADLDVVLHHFSYLGQSYRDIKAVVQIDGNRFHLNADSRNPDLDLMIEGEGSIAPDFYTADIRADIVNANLTGPGLSNETNEGHGTILLKGSASPNKWLYDVTLDVEDLKWVAGDELIDLSDGLHAYFKSTTDSVQAMVAARQVSLDFGAAAPLQKTISDFTKVADAAMAQISTKKIDLTGLLTTLPDFNLDLNASGKGILGEVLSPRGMSIDTVALAFRKDSLFTGSGKVININTGSLLLDTVTLGLNQRENLIDYELHLGNRPGTLDEFANVDLLGYIGENRLSAYLTQKNIQGQTGYRFGFTAALQDSTVSLHFTPLKATIGYIPWKVNDDNFIDYSFDNQVRAKLEATSAESKILLETLDRPDKLANVHLVLDNIRIKDFTNLLIEAPPVDGVIHSDLNLVYAGKRGFGGRGNLSVQNLSWEKQKIGTFDFGLAAGVDSLGTTGAKITLDVDGHEAVALKARIFPEGSEKSDELSLDLTKFPLKIANAFLGKDVAQLEGGLTGSLAMTGNFTAPVLNGSIYCDSVRTYIPMMGSWLKFDKQPMTVTDNVISLNGFSIFGQNDNPLVINGNIDAKKFSSILFDINAKATNFQLTNNDARARSDIYGKIFFDLDASAKGPLSRFDVNARLGVLSTTNAYYTLSTASELTKQSTDGVVKFVQFNDTTAAAAADSIASAVNMRINANLSIAPGTQVTVNLQDNNQGKVQVSPSGNLVYFQNYMGDMRLNGQINLGQGMAKYTIPVKGAMTFTINPNSYVLWNGDLLNPTLNINVYDDIKATVKTTGQNTRPVNFIVGIDVTNTLENPKVVFDLSTEDDLTINNELQSMSADQRSTQAMNLLLYGQYTGAGSKTQTNLNNTLYGMVESVINQWAARAIHGVDLSFGIDQYNTGTNGQNSTTTSYSYQLSKSLFNNRFKIVVGGNYSTDASVEDNFAQNLISNISFEYMLKQTNSTSMLLKLFRHADYESILEGEVTETGVGFVMKRRLGNLSRLFNFKRRKKNNSAATDTVANSKNSNKKVSQ